MSLPFGRQPSKEATSESTKSIKSSFTEGSSKIFGSVKKGFFEGISSTFDQVCGFRATCARKMNDLFRYILNN